MNIKNGKKQEESGIYKVVIVDDEQRIVDGLKQIMPWKEYNAEVVGTATTIRSALEVIAVEKPDILFTDIRLPDGTSLALLAGIRSQFPDMRVTVLTGYREFDYAKQAIDLGVTRFLLKPTKMDELTEALAEMVKRLDEQNAHKYREELRRQTITDVENSDEKDVASGYVVRQAIAYIDEHCEQRLTLMDVADACFVSQWHLSKILNKHLDQNFYDILNRARVKKAKELMLDASLRLNVIAEKIGYIDAPHFSRIFRKLEGMTPNEYRNSVLKQKPSENKETTDLPGIPI